MTPITESMTNILLVDDRQENLDALEALVKAPDVQVYKALSGKEALDLLLEHQFAVALLDVQMPGMDGFELAVLMRGTERTRHIPIIFVTAGERTEREVFEGYEHGAVDFLHKPLDPLIVKNKVETFCDLDRQKRELSQALSVREIFLSIVSHEMRTPLTSMLLTIDVVSYLLKSEGDLNEKREKLRSMMGELADTSKQLNELVDELLDVAKIASGKIPIERKDRNLSEVVEKAIKGCRKKVESSGSELRVNVEPAVYCNVDEKRFRQVVTNLLSNAARYGEGGPIEVSLKRRNGRAELSVTDQGRGIPEEEQEKIFQCFHRGPCDDIGKGLGLGLFIVKQIIDQHHGDVGVESEPGVYSKFSVELPCTA